MEGDKETKAEESKSAGCCSGSHGMKVLLIIIVILVVFAGLAGAMKLAFLHSNFGRDFIGQNIGTDRDRFGSGMMGGWEMHRRYSNSLVGVIKKVNADQITLHKDSNDKDYTVVISDTTQIRKDGEIAGKSDLAIGQAITVQGSANSLGQIQANIIIIN